MTQNYLIIGLIDMHIDQISNPSLRPQVCLQETPLQKIKGLKENFTGLSNYT